MKTAELAAELDPRIRQTRDRMEVIDCAQDYSRAELSAIFDTLKDVNNWKNPIVGFIHPALYPAARVAVEFYTGSKLKVKGADAKGRLFVKADGYYKACGA
jgi:hypothetical protein